MKKILILLAVVAIAAPTMADLSRSVAASPAPAPGTAALDARSTWVYDHTATNGYFQAFDTGDFWKGELCITAATGPWTMDGFSYATYGPTGTDYDVTVSFFDDDGYLPYSGNFVGSFSYSVVGGGLSQQIISLAGPEQLSFASPSVWFVYECSIGAGPLHVDQPGAAGTDYYANGWIDAHDDGYGGTAYSWSWYGGTPNADLYAAMSTPEPTTLLLLSLGGLALLRRR